MGVLSLALSSDTANSARIHHRRQLRLMAYMGSREMVVTHPSCNPIKAETETQSSTQSMKCAPANKSVVCRSAKCKLLRFNLGVKASTRRACFFQILAIFGTIMCRGPLLVDGSASADEKMNHLLIGSGDGSKDKVVLRGLPYSTRLGRPRASSLQLLQEDELEEILSVKLKLLRNKASAFRVFINLPDANEQTSIVCPEFAGVFFHEPRRVKNPDFEYQVTMFNIGIGDIIKDLGLMEQPSILVTFVPCGADKGLPTALENMQIELA